MSDRFERQAELVPPQRLESLTVDVIGVGAIGRQVALQLAALGTRRIRLFDPDHVEPTNVTTQGYSLTADLGLPKVLACQRVISGIDPSVIVEPVPDRYRSRHNASAVVFCCVDTISARAAIWRSAGTGCRFWSDGRMLGEVIRVLAVADGSGAEGYAGTLFSQSEAQTGRCTSRGTDPNYRIFVERGEIHVMNRDGYWRGGDPFELFEQFTAHSRPLEPSHAFYMGYELSKAVTALTLGKQYTQDQALQWGFLTVPEQSAIERRHAGRDSGN